MRDLASNIGVFLALAPAVQAATIKGNNIDLRDFDSAAIVINTGAVAGSGDYTAKIQESDTTTDGDFTDAVAADLVGTLPASLTENGSFKQSYVGRKRYIRVVVTKNSGTSVAAGAVAVLGRPHRSPVA